jgi:hypothetical protein
MPKIRDNYVEGPVTADDVFNDMIADADIPLNEEGSGKSQFNYIIGGNKEESHLPKDGMNGLLITAKKPTCPGNEDIEFEKIQLLIPVKKCHVGKLGIYFRTITNDGSDSDWINTLETEYLGFTDDLDAIVESIEFNETVKQTVGKIQFKNLMANTGINNMVFDYLRKNSSTAQFADGTDWLIDVMLDYGHVTTYKSYDEVNGSITYQRVEGYGVYQPSDEHVRERESMGTKGYFELLRFRNQPVSNSTFMGSNNGDKFPVIDSEEWAVNVFPLLDPDAPLPEATSYDVTGLNVTAPGNVDVQHVSGKSRRSGRKGLGEYEAAATLTAPTATITADSINPVPLANTTDAVSKSMPSPVKKQVAEQAVVKPSVDEGTLNVVNKLKKDNKALIKTIQSLIE